METYKEFLERINSFEKKELSLDEGDFCGNPSLVQKVDADNRFKKFYGDTIVFNFEDAVKEELAKYVEELYSAAPECFAEKLVSDTFHMTLHDLSNSPVLEDVAEELFWNELKVLEQVEKVRDETKKNWKIKMRTKCVFNMVNTSLVLGLYPTDEKEYEKLMTLYELFDEVKVLGYPFTPHITLAYYRAKGFEETAARKLEQVVKEMNEQQAWEIELDVRELYYQKFVSMNEYFEVVKVGVK